MKQTGGTGRGGSRWWERVGEGEDEVGGGGENSSRLRTKLIFDLATFASIFTSMHNVEEFY